MITTKLIFNSNTGCIEMMKKLMKIILFNSNIGCIEIKKSAFKSRLYSSTLFCLLKIADI